MHHCQACTIADHVLTLKASEDSLSHIYDIGGRDSTVTLAGCMHGKVDRLSGDGVETAATIPWHITASLATVRRFRAWATVLESVSRSHRRSRDGSDIPRLPYMVLMLQASDGLDIRGTCRYHSVADTADFAVTLRRVLAGSRRKMIAERTRGQVV